MQSTDTVDFCLIIPTTREGNTVELALFNHQAAGFVLRWVHLLAGITWIGLLYYFNFVQGEYFKVAGDEAKSNAIRKLVPDALWWFRWGAMFTFLSGALLIWFYMPRTLGFGITVGATLGILMFLNVWLIIWPNQKIVIASATAVSEGGDANPAAAAALGKAGLASRTNTLFSIPMLFFMASSVHLPQVNAHHLGSMPMAALALPFGLIIALELNGIFGKTGPFTTVKGVIGSGFALTAVLYLLIEMHHVV
jgi:uncharacterized membrane protein